METGKIEEGKVLGCIEGIVVGCIINFLLAEITILNNKRYLNPSSLSNELNQTKKEIKECLEGKIFDQLEWVGFQDVSEVLRKKIKAIDEAGSAREMQEIASSIQGELATMLKERLTRSLNQQLDTSPIGPERSKKVNNDVLKSIQRAENYLKAGDAKSFASNMRDAIERSIIDWYKKKVDANIPLEKNEPKINEMINDLEKQKVIPVGTGHLLKGIRSCCSLPGSHPVHYLGGLDEEEKDIMFNVSRILEARNLIVDVYQKI